LQNEPTYFNDPRPNDLICGGEWWSKR